MSYWKLGIFVAKFITVMPQFGKLLGISINQNKSLKFAIGCDTFVKTSEKWEFVL